MSKTEDKHKKTKWPVLTHYDKEHLSQIAFPLGGIGTGTISLGGRGQLRDWEIMNRPSKGFVPRYSFFALWATHPSPLPGGAGGGSLQRRGGDGQPVTRVLEGVLQPPYEGAFGATWSAAGLPRFRHVSFEAAYPLAQVHLADPSVPLNIRLEAFNPLIPHDADNSGLPVIVIHYVLSNPHEQPVQASVAGSVENFIGVDGPENAKAGRSVEYRDDGNLRGLILRSDTIPSDAPQAGTIVLATPHTDISYRRRWANPRWNNDLLAFWDDFSEDGTLDDPQNNTAQSHGSLAVSCTVPPKSEAEITFLLAWHFPNRTAQGCGWGVSEGEGVGFVGNYYAQKFPDAWSAAKYMADKLPELEQKTVEFVETFCSSTLPQEVKEATLNNLSTLRTQTCFRTPDGRFFGFEGCSDQSGCCMGSCTHVWNYEQATAFLFPELAHTMREVELKFSTTESGAAAFRTPLPLKRACCSVKTAADGQMGVIMKLYREWQLSGDNHLLQDLWPHAKRTLSFAWAAGSWDADQDGVMEGVQHNTYDVEFYGPNPMMGAWYLGALRAAEEMALAMNDVDFAKRCRELFERGRAWIDKNLFNGEYYIQQIRPLPEGVVPREELTIGMGAVSGQMPDYQVGEGCLVDQLVGQYMAHIVGLGYLLSPENVRTTMQSLYKYNFKQELYDHWNNMRTFALNDEAAMLICSWPKGGRPNIPFPYFSEVMTGFEYQAAVHLIYEGFIEQGLSVIRGIRARYDGKRRNPWDEAECGHHYARAMASWGTVLGLSGYRYSAVTQELSFAPKINQQAFQTFWSTGKAWGCFRQSIPPFVKGGLGEILQEAELSVKHGGITFKTFSLGWLLEEIKPTKAIVQVGEKALSAQITMSDDKIMLTFERPCELKAGETLRSRIFA
ncbi:hypothetical protein FJZ31_04030 [Candidatus Poribacteria bacterium]|nr:hypothetical protein [Candidatus Poribacteria bacterium]